MRRQSGSGSTGCKDGDGGCGGDACTAHKLQPLQAAKVHLTESGFGLEAHQTAQESGWGVCNGGNGAKGKGGDGVGDGGKEIDGGGDGRDGGFGNSET